MLSSPSSSAVPLLTPFKPKAAHTLEPLWKYVAENASFANGGIKKWSCSFCKLHFAGSYPRVRAHLLGIKNQGIQVCCKVSAEELACLTKEEHESAAKKQKSSNDSFNKKQATQPSVEGMFKNASREEVDEATARCFYACGLPFVLARSRYFQDMVITDSAANCKLAVHLVEKVFPHIFWTPCATHCLNLLLKDLALIGWMGKALDEGKEVQKFISNHDATRSMFSKFSKLKLVRRAYSRFASNFMMLHRLVRVKSSLKQLVTSGEWDQWKKQNDQADSIEKGFYQDGMLMYEEIRELAQERWDMVHSPLHATVFLLNPILFSKKPYKDKEVMKGWRKTLDRVGRDEAEETTLRHNCQTTSVSKENLKTYQPLATCKSFLLLHGGRIMVPGLWSCKGPCKAWDVLEDGTSWDASFEDEDEDDEMF
ncbi:hypothetical protein L7F22_045000 [Adiantum nelumboides]|nr:hypothetical protein [Adiantum nelumboides]